MSIPALHWARGHLADERLGDGERVLLLIYADHANEDGVCWPGKRGLAELLGVKPEAIRRRNRRLEECGLLRLEKRARQNASQQTNLVVLQLAATPPSSHERTPPSSGEGTLEPSEEPSANASGSDVRSTAAPTRGSPSLPEVVSEGPHAGGGANAYEVDRLCYLMAERVGQRTERKPPTITKAWLQSMDRLLRIDGRSVAEVEAAIEWVHKDDFWAANILSVPTLRKQFDRIRLQAQRRPRRRRGTGDLTTQDDADRLNAKLKERQGK